MASQHDPARVLEAMARILEAKQKERLSSQYSAAEFLKPAQIWKHNGLSMALDSCIEDHVMEAMSHGMDSAGFPQYMVPFIGYGAINGMHLDALYQNIIGSFVEKLTSKWLTIEAGTPNKKTELFAAKLQDAALKEFKLQKTVADAWRENFGWNGGGLFYIELKSANTEEQLKQPLIFDKEHIGKDDFVRFVPIEPFYCTPLDADYINPLSEWFFKPKYWRIGTMQIHSSRFIHFVHNKLPSMLRPAYNFMGCPWPQMLEPYRAGFDRARLASLDSIDNHALLFLKTSLNKNLQAGCGSDSTYARVKYLQMNRSNDGIAIIDKDAEEFQQINTPLTDLAELVTLNLEMMAFITRNSVTEMFGTPPRGLNASGDNYRYDNANLVYGLQMELLDENVRKMYDIISLSKFGKIEEDLVYKWVSTFAMSDDEIAERNFKNAQTAAIYSQDGPYGPIVYPEEIRRQLSEDKNSGYFGIDPKKDDSDSREREEPVNGQEENSSETNSGWADNGVENIDPTELAEKSYRVRDGLDEGGQEAGPDFRPGRPDQWIEALESGFSEASQHHNQRFVVGFSEGGRFGREGEST